MGATQHNGLYKADNFIYFQKLRLQTETKMKSGIEMGAGMEQQEKNEIRLELPEKVRQIIEQIQKHGFEAYAVGGCVRDSLLGRTPDDWDITTSAKPQEVKAIFPRTIDTGIEHGTVTVMMGKEGFEVTTYRIDGAYLDGRHPESVEFSSNLVEDLKRRDFTINAMAYNEQQGLVDVFEGIEDMQRKVIRCVGNPKERFGEDALRMMRAIRFSAQLGFEIEEETYRAVEELAPTLEKVSMERIQVELVKTLLSAHPDYVRFYQETGLFCDVLPQADVILSGKFKNPTLKLLTHAKNTSVLRYAALFHHAGPDTAKEALKRLKLDNYTVNTVSKLLLYTQKSIEENEPAVREATYTYGKEMMPLIFAHQHALLDTTEELVGIGMTTKRRHLETVERMYEDIIKRGDCISIKDLDITGNDLMEYGLTGTQIGKTLKDLLHIVLENPKLNEKETLVAMIEHLDL